MVVVTTATADPARSQRFTEVFRRAYEPVQRYVARRAPASVVDDVVADTFLAVWRRLDDVPAEAELPWCYGVARRTLANHRRGDERREALVGRLAAQPVVATEADDPVLDAALALLDADSRELLRLWAWEELPPRDIATVLGVSANAVSIRLHRAKRNLAGKIAEVAGQSTGAPTREEGLA
jgi:RNA polymerase sigma-70 factor (ECF subfamily)